MTKRILWINPVGTDKYDQPKREIFEGAIAEGSTINVVSLKRGPKHLEYRYYQALVLVDMLQVIRQAERDGYDAAVIGCFDDPGLREAREITSNLVVIAPGEATMHIASVLGHKFSIITGREKWVPQMHENSIAYGFSEKLASFKTIDLGADAVKEDPPETMKRLRAAAKEAIEEDRAEVIILGCARMFGFCSELQEDLHVPVIDPLLASLKYAEFQIELKQRFNWGHSKICSYESPPESEMLDWNLKEQYGLS